MLHLGSIRGTTIDVDPSFFFLTIFIVIVNYNPTLGMRYALLWIPVLFLSVLLHELAHAAMIGIFGYGSSHVVLGGMGGVTISQRRSKPWHDMVIALAGLAASFALAFGAAALIGFIPRLRADPFLAALLPLLAAVNFFWGILNSIPLPPLDGGHAVRGFFRTIVDERRAFVISVWIAMIIGGVAGVYFATQRSLLLTFFIALMVFRQYQHWRDFQERGVVSDD